jgi:phosphoribosylglycinamide formyltransferase-1
VQKKYGIPTVVMPKAEFNDEQKLMKLMNDYHIDFIVLAGFLIMAPDFLIKAFDHKIINIHPALLPKYGGKGMYGHHVHEAIKAAGEKETGMTVHYVSNECDGGEIIAQFHTPIAATDSPDDIAAKEHILEQKYFPFVIEKVLE